MYLIVEEISNKRGITYVSKYGFDQEGRDEWLQYVKERGNHVVFERELDVRDSGHGNNIANRIESLLDKFSNYGRFDRDRLSSLLDIS